METLPQNSFEQFTPFTPEGEEDAALNAMLGALDDLHTEFISDADTRRKDEEIMNAVQGVYSAGAEYGSGDLARTIRIFNEFEARLGAMQSICNHDHMVSDSLGMSPKSEEKPENSQDEDQEDDDYEIDPTTGKKKKKKRTY